MAAFSYRATTMAGEIIEGVIEARREAVAIERLKNTGLIPLKVVAPKEGLRGRSASSGPRGTF